MSRAADDHYRAEKERRIREERQDAARRKDKPYITPTNNVAPPVSERANTEHEEVED